MNNKEHSNFTLLTYNIELSRKSNEIVSNILSFKNLDVICLQEVFRIPGKEFIIDLLIKKLGSHWRAEYFLGEEKSYLAYGPAILWNSRTLTLQNIDKIPLPKLEKLTYIKRAWEYLIGYEGKPLLRKAIIGDFLISDQEIRITNIHLDAMGGPKQRKKELKYFMEKRNKLSNKKFEIICGDFNTFNTKQTRKEYKFLQEILQPDFIDITAKIPWTLDLYNSSFENSPWFFKKIVKTFHIHYRLKTDYIWTKSLETISLEYLQNLKGSDHTPIIAKVAI